MTDQAPQSPRDNSTDFRRLCEAYKANLVENRIEHVALTLTDLLKEPFGARDRQLVRGEQFCVQAMTEDGWAFGFAVRDGYAGWVDYAGLVGHPSDITTHRISVSRSYAKSTPGLKEPGDIMPLSHGTELVVLEDDNGWSRVAWTRGPVSSDLFVPSQHLVSVAHRDGDPVGVAAAYWGTPYLWGGNSAFGIDCSGLVQAACLACGIPCPGDSDMQEAELGDPLPDHAPLQRGDLLFWKGHVAWVADPDTLIHANAFHMAVAYEPIQDTINRIEAQGGGPVTARKRLKGPS